MVGVMLDHWYDGAQYGVPGKGVGGVRIMVETRNM